MVILTEGWSKSQHLQSSTTLRNNEVYRTLATNIPSHDFFKRPSFKTKSCETHNPIRGWNSHVIYLLSARQLSKRQTTTTNQQHLSQISQNSTKRYSSVIKAPTYMKLASSVPLKWLSLGKDDAVMRCWWKGLALVLKIAFCALQPQRQESFGARMGREGLYQISPFFSFSMFLLILSNFHCHCWYFQRVWDGSLLLYFCIYFLMIMFETLVASASLTSASSRSVLLFELSVSSYQHGGNH